MRFRLLLLLVVLCPALAGAEERSTLAKLGGMLSPGALVQAHAYLDTTEGCFTCHDLNQGVVDSKCLACHVEIAHSLKEGVGFHAKQREDKACHDCHGDHKGRFAKISDLKQVNHDRLGYRLQQSHQRVKCEKCHTQEHLTTQAKAVTIDGRSRSFHTYQGLTRACHSCHEHANPHANQFDDHFCQDCHTEAGWKHLESFDHSKDSKFGLEGKHLNLACNACHQPTPEKPKVVQFRGVKSQCSDCHKDPPPHQGEQFNTCNSCHQAQSWNNVVELQTLKSKFDHEKSHFPLKQMHKAVDCETCHPNKAYKLPERNECDTCHKEVRKVMAGDFTLEDGSRALPDPMYLTISCEGCHKGDDHHLTFKMVRKRCVDCHSEPFGDLWDYRVKKFGNRIEKSDKERKLERLKHTHRFSDALPQ